MGCAILPVEPSQIRLTGGFLADRFNANKDNRISDWEMVEGFIRQHERKDCDEWFWIGEQIGKWLDAASYACLSTGDTYLETKVRRAIERLAASQEADGYLGVTSRFHRNPVRGMQLYEWYYVLHGLLACHELLGSQQALDIAGKLGAYIVNYPILK